MLKSNKRSFLRAFLLSLAVAVSFSGCGLLPQEEETLAPPLIQPKKQEYELYEVKKGDITKTIQGNGSIISTNEISVFPKEAGRRLNSIKVKYGDSVKKGQLLVELDAGNVESSIRIQKQVLKKAQINLARAKTGTDTFTIQLAEVDVQIEKAKLEEMQNELNRSKLIAPISGIITFVDTLKPGDMLEAYKNVVTVSDPSDIQVLYTSTEASKVQTGMKAELNYNGTKCEGIVVQLGANTQKYQEAMKDAILISIKNTPKEAKIGDAIELAITLESKKNTIVIPKRAVKSFMGTNIVEVLDGNKKMSLNVDKGIETTTEVEILAGLKEGQKVILN